MPGGIAAFVGVDCATLRFERTPSVALREHHLGYTVRMGEPRELGARRVLGAVLVALGIASACSSDSDDSGNSSGSVWNKTTVPFDPDCADCEEIGTMSLPHMGEATLLRNSRVNDPEAQWSRCVTGILDCIEQGKDESACVSSSKCPDPCKGDYQAHIDALGTADVKAKWAAIRAVFVTPTSRCALPSTPEVTP